MKKITLPTNSLSKNDYEFYYENSVWENYEDLVYAIKRGWIEQAITLFR